MRVVGWGGVGWGGVGERGTPSYEREGGSENLVIHWGGGQKFYISHHEKCISFFGRGFPETSHYSYNFRLFSL